jgi:ATP-binding protein involved in chromosome partitioning
MSQVTPENIRAALARVSDPASGTDVIAANIISGITVQGRKAGFVITVQPGQAAHASALKNACETAVKALPGIEDVTVVLTSETVGQGVSAAASPARRAVWNTEPLPHVGRIIAVASGKGGVGKSTTSVNLAHALHGLGVRVGLLDADIYGPSIPRMMGLSGTPDVRDGKIIPVLRHGIACMSMGLLVGEESAMVWRGPQLSKALHQMLRGVAWGTPQDPLDILLIDMPPGTGDVHLSLVQQVPVNGAVIVTTPQEVAVADARKCIDMFRKVNVPVLGVIENMSGFSDPVSGARHAIFGEGGGKRLAEASQVLFFGEVPIVMELGQASDKGEVFSGNAMLYSAIARRLQGK